MHNTPAQIATSQLLYLPVVKKWVHQEDKWCAYLVPLPKAG